MSTLVSVCFILLGTGFYLSIDGKAVQLEGKVPVFLYADLRKTNLEKYINTKINEVEKQREKKGEFYF